MTRPALAALACMAIAAATCWASAPAHAMRAAAADLAALPAADRPWQRYVWLHDDQHLEADRAIVNFIANSTVSRSSVLIHPARPSPILVRYDLRQLAGGDRDDLAELWRLWERLRDDPYLHIESGGRQAWAYHVDIKAAQVLSDHQNGSLAGLVRADWFVRRVFTSHDGGLYYDFTQQRGLTFAELLEQLGAQVPALSAQDRTAQFRSQVTGKPRRVDVYRYGGLRPTAGGGLVTITRDVADDQVQGADTDPVRNLLRFGVAGGESIIQRANGTHLFTLFAGADGEIIDEAPPEIATDSTGRPHAPGGTRLVSGLSCVRCHREDGYRPLINDVRKLIEAGLDVYGDLRAADSYAAVDSIAGMYGGQVDGLPHSPLQRARDDYAVVVSRLTGWPANQDGAPFAVPELARQLTRHYARHNYDVVTAEVAVRELGLPQLIAADDPLAALREHLPPLPAAADGISPEDPVIAALKTGVSINRDQWAAIYPDVALRVISTLHHKRKAP